MQIVIVKAQACVNWFGEELFVKLLGFRRFTAGINTWYLRENIPSFLPETQCELLWQHGGLAVIAPLWCLSCAEHNFIATIREKTAPLSALQLLKAENNEREWGQENLK